MKILKLVSMTDFVLEQYKEKVPKGFNEHILDALDFEKKCISYANFLKQPLKLEMFVPCDEDGNVLEEPNGIDTAIETGYFHDYNKCRENVLFEGFSYNDVTQEAVGNFEDEVVYINQETLKNATIEDLRSWIITDLQLTPTAIKQIQP